MWGSPYFSSITSPAAAAVGSGFPPRANQPQPPPGVQQQIPQATPMQFPIARPAGVPSFTPFGSPPTFASPFNPRPVSQNSQMTPPTNQLANRSPIPSPRQQSLPFNSPSWQVRNSQPSPGLTPQQSFMPSTVSFPGVAVITSPQKPSMPSALPSPRGVITPPHRPIIPSTMPSPSGALSLPQRPFMQSTVPSLGGVLTRPQPPSTPLTVPTPGAIPSPLQTQRPFVSPTAPSPAGIPSTPQRQISPFTVLSPTGSVFSPPPSPRPFASATVPSPGGILSPSPPQRPPPGGFLVPTQQPFIAPTVPSPRRVLSPPRQPFVSATCPSPRGMAAPAQPPSPFNSPSIGGFPSPQRPLVPTTLPSPRGITSPAQQTLPSNRPSWRNPQTSAPGLNQTPSAMPSRVPFPRGIPPQFQQFSPFNSPQLPPRSSQPAGVGLNQGSIAAALDRHIIEKRIRNAASGGFKQMPVATSGQGTNLPPPPAHQRFSPISQPAQRRSTSSSHPHTRTGFYKDGERSRGQGIRRNYSNKSPRISRCFSPPPPDIARVMKYMISEEYYTKKQNDQVDNCGVEGTDKLTELHNRFEKEILNMASLEQDDSDYESISSGRVHEKDQDNSDMESLGESDVNESQVKSRLRLFPSDDEENSDEDSSEIESHALSDSTSDSDNDDDDSIAGGGLSDDDDDDAGNEHEHKGASVTDIRKRKIEDPCRLHPELWFNEAGETNDGPVCRCSSSDKRQGIRHGVYPGETVITPCDPLTNNADKLHHYWVTVTPHTNFMTSNPSIIHTEGKDYTFEGFSMFCHHPLEQVPICSVIRFNIEYTLHVISQPVPENFCIKDLDLFSQFLFYKVLELADWTVSGNVQDSCQHYHFMPRFVHRRSDTDDSKACHELLPMSQVLSHILDSAEPLVKLSHFDLSKEKWEKYNKSCRNAIVINPAKKPAALRVDDLQFFKDKDSSCKSKQVYPYIVHHSIRPVQMSFAGDPKYQRLLKTHNKLRNLISNTAVPTRKNQDKLVKLKIELEKMRLTSSMRRDVVVEVNSRGMVKTGFKSDICQHALLLPVLVHHVRYHMCLHSLDEKMGYEFKDRASLQLALTHPSYHLNFGMNPDHARNSLSNCGVKQPRYGDRKVRHLHTRKKGITQLIRVMSNLGKMEEHQSMIRHNERLEFLGDAVLELISSAHLYFMLPSKPEGGLAMYRSALVQNKHLAQLAKKLGLSDYMQYSHGPDLCLEEDLNHAMANCFEALLGAMYLESGLKPVTELFTKLAFDEEELREVWTNLPKHPLQAQQPDGDRHLIASSELLQKLQEFEQASGIEFTHIRLLARAFTHPQVGFNNLTLGSNQRMEFLGDSVLQFVVSVYLYKHFPEHHEGHLTLLRSSLVNHRIQAKLARELGLDRLINFGGQQTGIKAFREKLLADILEAFVAALYVDKGLRHVEVFCRVCLFPRLEEFIINQDWMDAKSQLQQCCLTSREHGKTPDLPQYKVLQNKGPAHHKHYTVAVYYKNKRLGSGDGKSIQQAEMAAAKDALGSHYFPELARQKRLLDRKHQGRRRNYWNKAPRTERENEDQGDVEFKPQWEEMETFEAAQNRHARENREDDERRECWETEDMNSETGEDYDDERSDARETWEEEMGDTTENWEEEMNDTKENWEEKQKDTTEMWEEEKRDVRENWEGKSDTMENWKEGDGERKENYEEGRSIERENWEEEKSNTKGNWERENSDTEADWEEEMNLAGENWGKESNDKKEDWEEDKDGAREEKENWEDENVDSKDDCVQLKENWEENLDIS